METPNEAYVQYPRGMGSPSGPPRVRIEIIGDAVNLFSKNPKPYIIASIPSVILTGVYWVTAFISNSTLGNGRNLDAAIGMALLSNGILFFSQLLLYIQLAGLIRMGLRQMRGEEISAGDVWNLDGTGWSIFGAILAVGFFSILGVCACIIGAYVVYGLALLTFPLITEEKMDPSNAFRSSWQMLKPDLWMAAGFGFLLSLIQNLSPGLFIVGLALGLPLKALSIACLYRDYANVPRG